MYFSCRIVSEAGRFPEVRTLLMISVCQGERKGSDSPGWTGRLTGKLTLETWQGQREHMEDKIWLTGSPGKWPPVCGLSDPHSSSEQEMLWHDSGEKQNFSNPF